MLYLIICGIEICYIIYYMFLLEMIFYFLDFYNQDDVIRYISCGNKSEYNISYTVSDEIRNCIKWG